MNIYDVKFGNLDNLLARSDPDLNDILNDPNVVDQFKLNKPQLVSYIASPKKLVSLIAYLHDATNPQRSRKIIDMFIGSNKALLMQLITHRKLVEKLISVLGNEETPHISIITAITQICIYAFNERPREMFAIFNSSQSIFPNLLKHVEKLPVFSLLRTLLKSPTHSQTYLWFYFVALMDDHGVGTETPEFIEAEFALRTPEIHLMPDQRKNVIELLSLLFQIGGAIIKQEFVRAVTQGLPLILQDANSDAERAAVIKLGLNLPANPTVCLSCVSVIECFRVPCELLQSSMRYLAQSQYKLDPDLAELLLYKLIRNNSSNIIVRESLPLFQALADNNLMQSNLIGILNYCYEKTDWKNHISSRTIRTMLIQAILGKNPDPLDLNYQKSLKSIVESQPDGFIDQNRLVMLRQKSTQPLPCRFNAIILWGQEAAKFAKIYKDINKPNYLKQLNPKKFEDVHFVAETKPVESAFSWINAQTDTQNFSSCFKSLGVDEFDNGDDSDNPFLTIPPPEALATPRNQSYLIPPLDLNRSLALSDSFVVERPENEVKSANTQTKDNRQDAMVSTTTNESAFFPCSAKQKKVMMIDFAKSDVKTSTRKEVNQIEAPPLDLPVLPSGLQSPTILIAPQRGNSPKNIHSLDQQQLQKTMGSSPTSETVVKQKPAPATPSNVAWMAPASRSPFSSNGEPYTVLAGGKNPLVDTVLNIMKQPAPPPPQFSTSGMNIDWVKLEMARSKFKAEKRRKLSSGY